MVTYPEYHAAWLNAMGIEVRWHLRSAVKSDAEPLPVGNLVESVDVVCDAEAELQARHEKLEEVPNTGAETRRRSVAQAKVLPDERARSAQKPAGTVSLAESSVALVLPTALLSARAVFIGPGPLSVEEAFLLAGIMHSIGRSGVMDTSACVYVSLRSDDELKQGVYQGLPMISGLPVLPKFNAFMLNRTLCGQLLTDKACPLVFVLGREAGLEVLGELMNDSKELHYLPSLAQMLSDPTTKRLAWQVLKPYRAT